MRPQTDAEIDFGVQLTQAVGDMVTSSLPLAQRLRSALQHSGLDAITLEAVPAAYRPQWRSIARIYAGGDRPSPEQAQNAANDLFEVFLLCTHR